MNYQSEKAIIERRAAAHGEMEMIQTLAKREDRKLTTAETDKFLQNSHEIIELTEALERLRDEVQHGDIIGKPGHEPGMVLYDMMRSLYTGEQPRREPFSPRRDFTLAGTTATIQDPQVNQEFFLSLKARNPLDMMGARFIQGGPNFNQFPVETTAPTVTWFEEGDTLTDGGGVIGAKKIEYRTAAILLKASNFWLEDSAYQIGGRVITDMALDAINEAIVKVALHGAAADGQPVGLDNVANVQTVAAGGAIVDYSKHIEAVRKLLAANVVRENITGIMSPKAWEQIQTLRETIDVNEDPTGQHFLMPPGIVDLRQYVSSAVLEDYGTDPNFTTRIYLGDFSNMLIGMSGPRVQILKERYADEMTTGFLVHLRIDMQVVRPTAFCRIEGIAV